ncbi:hypothetical protein [Candidatus Poriferisodalis sp.]|uniref:hypothetical protein n=1 Tax=Candidatus Poriferisodalis sp. TaxID=3101277 RepID=UPI003B02EBC4
MALVSVGGHDTPSAISSFVSRYGLGHLTNLPDVDNELARTLGVSYHPRWLLIRADGTDERGGGAIPDSIVTDALTPG